MEVGAYHDGFCDPLATDIAGTRCGMGDSGPAHEVGSFSSRTDDLHIGEILPIVHSRDSSATWSTSIHSVGQRPEVYGALLEEFSKGHGHTADHEYNFLPIDRFSVREDHIGIRGHATSMRPGS